MHGVRMDWKELYNERDRKYLLVALAYPDCVADTASSKYVYNIKDHVSVCNNTYCLWWQPGSTETIFADERSAKFSLRRSEKTVTVQDWLTIVHQPSWLVCFSY